ncbi:hypothetical protein QFZ28_004461 [Neobacillus niacini]|uniref:hypothetical protein n=1 Tax=Neobacillus niacini TaxID=86668 RepID=UPI0027853653|nr:hypothetical protein [Neobacillus niacini]MDQ1004061.1 hypothetical protein [Neobacillus niacini]
MKKSLSRHVEDDQTNLPDQESNIKTPLWVKVFGIIGIILVLLFVILHLTGNSFGPGLHQPPSSVNEQGEQLP